MVEIPEPPERYIDDTDGAPIEYVEPKNSRFDGIGIKQRDNEIEVRAYDQSSDRVIEFTAELTNKQWRGVTVDRGRRREIDDDIQDVLTVVGYALIDDDIESY